MVRVVDEDAVGVGVGVEVEVHPGPVPDWKSQVIGHRDILEHRARAEAVVRAEVGEAEVEVVAVVSAGKKAELVPVGVEVGRGRKGFM